MARSKLPDNVMADIIFPLSHEKAEPRPKYINYRDLSVQQLGSIYERLLEYEVVAETAQSRSASIPSRARAPVAITRPSRW